MNNNKNIWIICQYASPIEYGFGTRHYYLAEEWVKKGHTVSIITSTFQHVIHTEPPNKKLFNLEQNKGIDTLWIKGLKYKNPSGFGRVLSWFHFVFLSFFIPYKKLNKPDTIIVSSMSLFPIINGYFLKKKFKARLIFEIRDIWPLTITNLGTYSKYNPLVLILSILEKFAYSKADYITATMPKADLHIKQIIKTDFKFKCIPQGISTSFLKTQENLGTDFIKKYIPKNKFIIGYAGAIGISNALEYLIQAAIKIEAINPQIHFILIGEGPLKEKLIEKTINIKNITFAPKVSKNKIKHFLSFCDVVYDSVKNVELYNFGLSRNKWMDYMYAAKPIIASYSGYQSLINDAGCGSFIPAEDTKSLVNEIIKYSKMEKTELQEMGNKGKEYLLKNRLFDTLALQFEEIF